MKLLKNLSSIAFLLILKNLILDYELTNAIDFSGYDC